MKEREKLADRPVKLLFHPLQLVWGENGSVRMESELEQYKGRFHEMDRLKIDFIVH
jgi:hypothetical protein